MLQPYKFQQEIIDRFKLSRRFALFMDMGTGKTCVAINLLREIYKKYGKLLPTIIMGPSIVGQNWKDEFAKFSQIPEKYIGVVEGSKKKRIEIIRKHPIIIVNYETVRVEYYAKELLAKNPACVVLDEAHRIKNRTSATFKQVKKISRNAFYRGILTGTPITNSPDEIWALYYFLDNGATFGSVYFAFRNRYFVNLNADWKAHNSFPNWQIIKSRIPEMREKIAKTSVRLMKEDCIDLPKFVQHDIKIPLSPEQKKHSDELKKELITWIDGQEDNPLMVQNALVKVLRLNQISSGFLKLEDGTVVRLKSNPRLDELNQLVKDLHPYKIIIFCVYKENYEDIARICKKQGVQYIELHGAISAKQKQKNIKTFTNDTEVRVCIANPHSAGIGINLICAPYTIYWTRNYSLEDYLQSKDRNYRGGAVELHEKITHYHFVAPGTIDEEILDSLKNKKKIAQKLIDVKHMVNI